MSAPDSGPQHRAPRRFTRLQKVTAATGVAAVGAGALAFGLGAGQDEGASRVAGGDIKVKPVAWQTAEHSVDEQRESVSQQSSHADTRAKAEAEKRAEAKKKRAEKERAEKAEAERLEKAAEAERQERAADAERSAKAKAEAGAEDRKRAADEEPASRSSERTPSKAAPSGSPREIARQIVGDGEQFQCFSQIVERESGWNVTAQNPSSGAYGLVQALPGTKMASEGADWRTNPETQIKWGLSYMNETYGSPCGAWSFWQSHNAY